MASPLRLHPDVKRQKAGIAFVHVSDPSGQVSRDPKVRRLIRSHVSRVQHSRRFEGDAVKPSDALEVLDSGIYEFQATARESDEVKRTKERRQRSPKPASHDGPYDHEFSQDKSTVATPTDRMMEDSHSSSALNDQTPASPLHRNPRDLTDDLQRYLDPLQLNLSDCLVIATDPENDTRSLGLTRTGSL